MFIQVLKRTQEEIADFFHQNKWVIARLLPDEEVEKETEEDASEEETDNTPADKEEDEVTGEDSSDDEEEEAEAERAPEPDDLTKLKGLGAKMAERLAKHGVTTFAQLANLTKAQVEELGENIRGFKSGYSKKKWKKHAKEHSK